MNKQRKVLITITYNEMGIIIDTKAEEVAQPNLQPTCNNLATDAISRQAAIEAIEYVDWYHQNQHGEMVSGANSREHQAWYRAEDIYDVLERLPSAQPEIKPIEYRDCANAMLRMWMDNVVTDGEYNRIMGKLNAHWGMENG